MVKIKNGILTRIIIYTILILVLYTSGSVYDFRYNQYSDVIKISLSFICIFLFVSTINMCGLSKKWVFRVVLITMVFILLAILNQSNIANVIGVSLRILGMFAFAEYCYNKEISLAEMMYNLVFVIAIVYLVFYFYYDVFRLGNDITRIVLSTSNGKRGVATSHLAYTVYDNLYYRWQTIHLPVLLWYVPRCNGPFWEPGYYQIYLNYGLLYALFIDKTKTKHIVLLMISIFTTTSAMGLIIMFMLIGLRVLHAKYNAVWKVVILFPVSLVLIITIMVSVRTILILKMTTYSYAIRTNDLYAWIKDWNPIIGDGLYSKGANMSGFLNLFQEFGIIGGLLYYYPLKTSLQLSVAKGKMCMLAFGAWFLLSYLNEPLTYHNITLLFFGICISYNYIAYTSDSEWRLKET